jgi:hypothetical protein
VRGTVDTRRSYRPGVLPEHSRQARAAEQRDITAPIPAAPSRRANACLRCPVRTIWSCRYHNMLVRMRDRSRQRT